MAKEPLFYSSMTPFMILLAVPFSSTRFFCSSSVTTSSPPRLLTCLARKLAVDFARAPPSCSRESEPSSLSQNGVRAVWAAPVCGERKVDLVRLNRSEDGHTPRFYLADVQLGPRGRRTRARKRESRYRSPNRRELDK